MTSRRVSTVVARSAALLLLTVGAATAQASRFEGPWLVALSTIDQTQVELTQSTIDRYVDASLEMFRTPDLRSSQASDPARRPLFDAIAARHGFVDYRDYETAENNIGFVLAGTDPDTKRYVGRDAVIAKLVADAEKDTSVPDSVKASRVAIIRSMKDDTPDLKYPGNVAIVIGNYDRILRSMKGKN